MATQPQSPQQTARFDPMAELYERFAEITDSIHRPWLSRTVPDLRPGRGGRAVDLGCGSGRFTGLLADRYDEVLAVDISERELEIARTRRGRSNIRYEKRDLREVTAERDGHFDLVLSVNVLHHLRDGNGRDTVLPQIRSLVAPGGHLVISEIVAPPPHRRSRSWERWTGMQRAAGTLLRRRSVSDALVVLKLWNHAAWLDHTTTSKKLSRDDIHTCYGQAFPGATFTDNLDPVVCGIRWQAPEQ